jgi:Flp pilus assembly pilin Flp
MNQRPVVTRSRKLMSDTRGANLVEYIILVGVVAILCIAGFKIFGQAVSGKIEKQGGAVNGVPDTAQ